MTLGKRISELRNERKYSQEYLAECMHVSRQAVSKWENDVSSPDTNNLIQLAELFGVSVEYLATGKKAEPLQPPVVVREDYGALIHLLNRASVGSFLIALICHLIGIFSGEFTDNLIPVFPYLWYGKSAIAVVLNVCAVLFTVVCIGLFAFVLGLKRKNAPSKVTSH